MEREIDDCDSGIAGVDKYGGRRVDDACGGGIDGGRKC